ncbi:MAG: trypsin-like peptidase domain-containing protein [Planctomycetota bacterium]
MTRRTPDLALLLLAALVGAVTAGAFLSQARRGGQQPAAAPEAAPDARSLSRAFQDAARRVRPSVLNITTERWSGGERNGPFVQMLAQLLNQRTSPQLERSYGTGFVVRADGVALTNHHVVADAKRVLVRLSDGKEVSARVIGSDPLTDLAVIELGPHPDGQAYVPVAFGDADALEVGDWVLATGNPFGLDQTVTAGVVSAKGRSRMGIAAYEDFIQTDAAINPGNSGGPLLDLEGRVVGVTTAIASRSGEYSGIGFAIPSGMARAIMEKLLASGRVSRGWLGVSVQDAEPEVLRRLGFGEQTGALVAGVLDGSPAQVAGLRPGDLITRIDGREIQDGTQLSHQVAEVEVGRTIRVALIREGERREVEAKVIERPDTPRLDGRADGGPGGEAAATPEPAAPRTTGISARALTPELASFFGFAHDPAQPAVVVAAVEPGSLAAQHGIRPGMVIQQVERTRIQTLDDLEQALRGAELVGRGILLKLWDGRGARVVLLR